MNVDGASKLIRRWFSDSLIAVDPEQAVAKRLKLDEAGILVSGQRIAFNGRLIVIAVGKAAVPMARAAESAFGERIDKGFVLTKDGHSAGAAFKKLEIREASHPIPDQRGVYATNEILALLRTLSVDDLVIGLISGGGSALLESPVEGVSLSDIANITDLMLRAGAPIEDLNSVRRPLSLAKGGGLRAAAPKSRFVTLILSDVLGNDFRVIASGPTAPSLVDGERAIALTASYRFQDRLPHHVIDALNSARTQFVDTSNDIIEIVADNRVAVQAFADSARRDGIVSRIAWSEAQGEARNMAKKWVELLPSETSSLLLGGGEATVTVRGDGMGGRNTEFALAAAIELESRGIAGWVVASLATDGQDGPTNVAGAIGSIRTTQISRERGVEPHAALDRNDSLAVFRAAGGDVVTGPTGTNVNDIYVALRLT